MLLHRSPVITSKIEYLTERQLETIESGSLPKYREAFNLAMALKYYTEYKSALSKPFSELSYLLTRPIFNNCKPICGDEVSGLYAYGVTSGIVDESDEYHHETAAFTRSILGGKGVRHHDTVDITLSAIGHSSGIQFLNTVHNDVLTGNTVDSLLELMIENEKPNSSKKARFGQRLAIMTHAIQSTFEKADSYFSLSTNGEYPASGRYSRYKRGSLVLDPHQLYDLLKSPFRQQNVLTHLENKGVVIPQTLPRIKMLRDGLNFLPVNRLASRYKDMSEFERVLVLASLGSVTGSLFEKSLDYKQVLTGNVPRPKTIVAHLFDALENSN